MSAVSRRRWSNTILLLLTSIAVIWSHAAFSGKLGGLDYLTGWVLLAAILFLAAYNARKKISFLPLGSSETWLQAHIYVGYLTFVLFLVHLNYRVPAGWFEIAFATVFGTVMLSG